MEIYQDAQGRWRKAKTDSEGRRGQYAKTYSRQFEDLPDGVGAISSGRVEGITEPTYHSSSRVQYVRYDYDNNKMAVKFFKLGRNLGLCYVYEVAPVIYSQFLTAPSLGKYINAVLNSQPYHPADELELQMYFYGDRYGSPDPAGLRSRY